MAGVEGLDAGILEGCAGNGGNVVLLAVVAIDRLSHHHLVAQGDAAGECHLRRTVFHIGVAVVVDERVGQLGDVVVAPAHGTVVERRHSTRYARGGHIDGCLRLVEGKRVALEQQGSVFHHSEAFQLWTLPEDAGAQVLDGAWQQHRLER